MKTLTPELQEAIRDAEGAPILMEDPQSHAKYVLVRQEMYDRVKALLEEDLPSADEQMHFLREAGKAAGWDDPEMDIYNDMK